MAINVKFLTGSKAEIDNQIVASVIDAGDIVFTSDTDELVFINPSVEKKFIKSKTQNSYTLQGTDLGGLKDGATIAEGTDIDELLRLITTKVIPATYKSPTLKITSEDEYKYEAGSLVTTSIQSQFTQNDAGALTAHNILKDGVVIYEGQTVSPIGASDSFIISDGTVTFESQAQYNPGDIKNNNLGEASPEGAIPAGILTSQPIVFNGYRKLFYGTGAGEIPELNSENIRMLDDLLNPVNGTEFSINMMTGEQYAIFAYPSYLNEVEQITYVQMNDTEMAPSFVKTYTIVEGANGYEPIEYRVYIYKTDAPVSSKVTFKVKIGG